MRPGTKTQAFKASHYAATSLLSRLIWACTTIYLVAILSINEYGRFSFIQIVTGLTSQVILGALGNIVGSRISSLAPPERTAVLFISIVYGVVIVALTMFSAIAADIFSIISFGGGQIVIVGLWILAGHVATVQLGYLLAEGQYLQAAAVSILQPILYLLLIFGLPTASGEAVAMYAAIALGLPSSLLLLLGRRANRKVSPSGWRAMADDHRHSMVMNLAALPGSIALLLVASALASSNDPTQLAIYGVANQVIGLFYFLPTTIGGLAIPYLTRADAPARRTMVRVISLGMILLSVACAVAYVFAVDLPLVPQLFEQGRFEIALAFLLAGLATARSPQVWVNQINRHSGAESAPLLLNFVFLATLLFMSPITAMLALAVRTAGAGAALAVSLVLARSRG